jgi:hypothetical protein
MDRTALLDLFAQARRRAEAGDLGIADQQKLILDLEDRGLDSRQAEAILDKLVRAQDFDLAEMERLLDELDKPD